MQTLVLKRSFAFVAAVFMATLLMQIVSVMPTHAFQDKAEWDGGGSDNKFSTDANWVGDVAPSGGESVYLKTQHLTGDTFDNDLAADTSFESIVLVGTGTEDSYTLTGSSIILTSAEDGDKLIHGGLINATDEYEVKTFKVELDITLAASMDFYAGWKTYIGKSDGTSTLDLGAFTMTKAGTAPLKIYSAVSGTGAGGVTVSDGEYVVLKDSTAAFTIGNGGTLKGNDVTVGDVTVESGGEVAPGMSPGCITTGNLTFTSGSTFTVEIDGGTVCDDYDQTVVTGTVILGDATLAIARLASYEPADGTEFIIIDNDGTADLVSGTFAGLAEGESTTVDGTEYTVSYVGGDGNDVVLSATMVAVPAEPDTGFGSVASNYALVALATVALAGGIVFTARKLQKTNI